MAKRFKIAALLFLLFALVAVSCFGSMMPERRLPAASFSSCVFPQTTFIIVVRVTAFTNGLVHIEGAVYARTFFPGDGCSDGSNWYAYCAGDPINSVDLWGLCPANIGNLAAEDIAAIEDNNYGLKNYKIGSALAENPRLYTQIMQTPVQIRQLAFRMAESLANSGNANPFTDGGARAMAVFNDLMDDGSVSDETARRTGLENSIALYTLEREYNTGENIVTQLGRESQWQTGINLAALSVGLAFNPSISSTRVLPVSSPPLKTANITDDLTAAAQRAVKNAGNGSGAVYGTKVHSAFETEVNALGNANLKTELSYMNGQPVKRGTAGSVRLDVVEFAADGKTILNVYDLKTGSATLTTQRIQEIQSHIPGGPNVPIIEVRP